MLHRPTLTILLILLGTPSVLTAQAPAKRPIQSSDLFRLRAIGDPQRSPDGAWVHAYLHRKEGDAGNAGYWYTRAGQPVARRATPQRDGTGIRICVPPCSPWLRVDPVP